jgi:hypothetical protein
VALVPSLRVVTKGRAKQPDDEGLVVGAEVEPTSAADDDGPFVDADV